MKEHVYDRISEIKVIESPLTYSNLPDLGTLEENENHRQLKSSSTSGQYSNVLNLCI